MPNQTTRSHFSFAQFCHVFQQMAHKVAMEAVEKRDQGRTRIIIDSSGEFADVETEQWHFKFYAKHLSVMKGSWNRGPAFSVDIEDKNYTTSNHSTRLAFYVQDVQAGGWEKDDYGILHAVIDKEKTKQAANEKERKVMAFIDKVMADAGIKPVPRFSLAAHAAA